MLLSQLQFHRFKHNPGFVGFFFHEIIWSTVCIVEALGGLLTAAAEFHAEFLWIIFGSQDQALLAWQRRVAGVKYTRGTQTSDLWTNGARPLLPISSSLWFQTPDSCPSLYFFICHLKFSKSS